jgi:predicted HTH domain antitoxin
VPLLFQKATNFTILSCKFANKNITMSVLVSEEIMRATGRPEEEIRLELAIFFYQHFKVSAGKAATFAGLSRIAFWRELAARKIPLHYDVADLEQDVKTLEEFRAHYDVGHQ